MRCEASIGHEASDLISSSRVNGARWALIVMLVPGCSAGVSGGAGNDPSNGQVDNEIVLKQVIDEPRNLHLVQDGLLVVGFKNSQPTVFHVTDSGDVTTVATFTPQTLLSFALELSSDGSIVVGGVELDDNFETTRLQLWRSMGGTEFAEFARADGLGWPIDAVEDVESGDLLLLTGLSDFSSFLRVKSNGEVQTIATPLPIGPPSAMIQGTQNGELIVLYFNQETETSQLARLSRDGGISPFATSEELIGVQDIWTFGPGGDILAVQADIVTEEGTILRIENGGQVSRAVPSSLQLFNPHIAADFLTGRAFVSTWDTNLQMRFLAVPIE